MANGTPAGRPNGNGSVTGRVLGALAAITTWKQLGITLALGSAGFVGVLVYQHPGWIERTLPPTKDELAVVPTAQLAVEVPGVRKQLAAPLLFVLGCNPARNETWLLAYDAAPDVRDAAAEVAETRWGTALPLFAGSYAWNMMLVGILDGEVSCIPLGDDVGALIVRALHLVEICAAGLPPGPRGLVGLVVAGFTEPQNRPALLHIRTALRAAALRWTVNDS